MLAREIAVDQCLTDTTNRNPGQVYLSERILHAAFMTAVAFDDSGPEGSMPFSVSSTMPRTNFSTAR